jgi:hypothetical protein
MLERTIMENENKNQEVTKEVIAAVEAKLEELDSKSESTTETTPVKESYRSKDDGLNPDGTVKTPTEQGYDESKKEVSNEVSDEVVVVVKKEEKIADKAGLSARLIQAGKRNGLDDDAIKGLGDKAEKILSKMADNSDAVSIKLGELGRLQKLINANQPEKKEEKKSELNLDEVDGTTKKIVEMFKSEIDSLKTQLKTKDTEDSAVAQIEIDNQIDTYFDSKADQHKELGKTKSMTKLQNVIRHTIWNDADDILVGAEKNGHPITVEEALDRAFSIWEKDNSVNVTDEEIAKREKQQIHKPSGRKTEKQGGSATDAAVAAVKRWMDEHPVV